MKRSMVKELGPYTIVYLDERGSVVLETTDEDDMLHRVVLAPADNERLIHWQADLQVKLQAIDLAFGKVPTQ